MPHRLHAALAQLDSLIALVDLRGTVLQCNRPMPEPNLLHLVAEADRDRVRQLLLHGGFAGQPTRVRITDTRGEHGWLELAPAGDGNLAVIWLLARSVGVQATPPPARRREAAPGPPLATAAADPDDPAFAIVADPEHREVVAALRSALDTVSPSVAAWFVPDMTGNLGGLDQHARILVIGDSRYTRFLRSLAGEPSWASRGVCWSREGRRAAIWYQDPAGEPLRDHAVHEAELAALQQELEAPQVGRFVEPELGNRLARHFLVQSQLEAARRRRAAWPERLRYTLGVGRFLLSGFEDLQAFGQRRRPWAP